MAKKLALVVHGIGEQLPGETLDRLVGATTGDQNCQVQTERRFLREVDLDGANGEYNRNAPLFETNISRVKKGEDEVVFAEVFWGDLSRGAKGQIGTLIELFKVIGGLGHVVRENAAEIHPSQKGEPQAWPRRAANFFVYLLHGPITALNLFLALAAVVFFGLDFVFSTHGDWITPYAPYLPTFTVLMVAAVMVLVRGVIRKNTDSYLFQIFWRWMRIVPWFLVVLVGLNHGFLVNLDKVWIGRLFQFFYVQAYPDQCGSFSGCCR